VQPVAEQQVEVAMNAPLHAARGQTRRAHRRAWSSPRASFRWAAPRGPRETAPQPAASETGENLPASCRVERRSARDGHLKRVLELVEGRRSAAVVGEQGSLLAVRARHTLKAALRLQPRASALLCACTAHLVRHAEARPLAVRVWRHTRGSARGNSVGCCLRQHPASDGGVRRRWRAGYALQGASPAGAPRGNHAGRLATPHKAQGMVAPAHDARSPGAREHQGRGGPCVRTERRYTRWEGALWLPA
jgi:hypothetical protein